MNKLLNAFLLIILFANTSYAQSFDSLYKKGLELESNKQEKMALSCFLQAQKIQPTNLSVIYKCGELCNRIGARENNQNLKLNYYNQSLSFAKIAYKYHSNTDDANVLMSMALGRIAMQKNGREKIEDVKLIKQYADRAIKINPNNYKAWHIIGKWNYEVSSLNFIEKTAIKLFYGGIPDASYEKAVYAYQKAKAIQNNFSLNSLELAKAYYKLNKVKLAKDNLFYLLQLPNYTEDDLVIKNEANSLLKKWE